VGTWAWSRVQPHSGCVAMRDPPKHRHACGIACVDPHPTTLARPPRREEESSGALEQTCSHVTRIHTRHVQYCRHRPARRTLLSQYWHMRTNVQETSTSAYGDRGSTAIHMYKRVQCDTWIRSLCCRTHQRGTHRSYFGMWAMDGAHKKEARGSLSYI